MGRNEKIFRKHFQKYQGKFLNHVTHLNLLAIKKASLNQISLFTGALHFRPSVRTGSFSSQGKWNESYFAAFKERITADHPKILADQVKETAERKLKTLEESLDLEMENKLKMRRLEQGVRP